MGERIQRRVRRVARAAVQDPTKSATLRYSALRSLAASGLSARELLGLVTTVIESVSDDRVLRQLFAWQGRLQTAAKGMAESPGSPDLSAEDRAKLEDAKNIIERMRETGELPARSGGELVGNPEGAPGIATSLPSDTVADGPGAGSPFPALDIAEDLGDASPIPSAPDRGTARDLSPVGVNLDEPVLRARIDGILGAGSFFLASRVDRAVRLSIKPAMLARVYSIGDLDSVLDEAENRLKLPAPVAQTKSVEAVPDPAVQLSPEAKVHAHLVSIGITERDAVGRETYRRVARLFGQLRVLKLRPETVAVRLLGVQSASALDNMLSRGFGLPF